MFAVRKSVSSIKTEKDLLKVDCEEAVLTSIESLPRGAEVQIRWHLYPK